jgi:hypothetical protein
MKHKIYKLNILAANATKLITTYLQLHPNTHDILT